MAIQIWRKVFHHCVLALGFGALIAVVSGMTKQNWNDFDNQTYYLEKGDLP